VRAPWYAWSNTAAPYFYSFGLWVAVLFRIVLLGGFLFFCLKDSDGRPLKAIRAKWRMQQPRNPDEHTALLGLFESSRTVALTVGSLGLAAWSVLSAFHPAGIQSRGLGLELLFIGVILSIAAPMFFRLEGSDGSEMGLESMISLSYLALVFALADILNQVFGRRWLNVIGVLVVVFMLVRELMEVRDQARLYWPRAQKKQAPTVSISPSPVDFGSLAVGQTRTSVVTVKNTGTAALVVQGASDNPPGTVVEDAEFVLGNDAVGGATINPEASATLDLNFTPSAKGLRVGTLTINCSAGTFPIHLAGTGT
jgi:hypothetical protein